MFSLRKNEPFTSTEYSLLWRYLDELCGFVCMYLCSGEFSMTSSSCATPSRTSTVASLTCRRRLTPETQTGGTTGSWHRFTSILYPLTRSQTADTTSFGLQEVNIRSNLRVWLQSLNIQWLSTCTSSGLIISMHRNKLLLSSTVVIHTELSNQTTFHRMKSDWIECKWSHSIGEGLPQHK